MATRPKDEAIMGLFTWYPVGNTSDGDEPNPDLGVDIIAVQGLGASPYYTWVKKVLKVDGEFEEVMWLRDLLPKFVPNARIATFSYRSDWYTYKKGAKKTSIRELGEQLLTVLHLERQRNKALRRPIVFVGHSMGGLVIKQALILAKSRDDYEDIRISTAGIIFLGTPHEGVTIAEYAGYLAVVRRNDPSLLDQLVPKSEQLYHLAHDFAASYKYLSVTCFYEKLDNTYLEGYIRVPIVDQRSAVQFGKEMIFLISDHSGLNKYSGVEDPNFKLVCGVIVRMATARKQSQAESPQLLLTDRSQMIPGHDNPQLNGRLRTEQVLVLQQRFKDSLFFPEIFSRRDEIRVAHEGTCRWVFKAGDRDGKLGREQWPSLADWLEHGDQAYWLSGKPGSGKSTLMKYIVNEFQTHLPKEQALNSQLVAISFFFWSEGSCALQKNFIGLLRSMLYQIADQRPELISVMIEGQPDLRNTSYTGYHHIALHAWTEQRLLSVFKELLPRLPSSLDMYFFIDGLDEFLGDEDDLISLVHFISQIPRVKMCVSSRPEQIFRHEFAQSPQIRLQDLNYQDTMKVATDTLHPVLFKPFLRRPEEYQIEGLITKTVDKSQGVFLWLVLMLKSLKRGAHNSDTIPELEQRLERTPDTIEGLYKHLLESMDECYFSEAFRFFELLLKHEEGSLSPSRLTLLDLVFAEGGIGQDPATNSDGYFMSQEFMHHCLSVETRILTRCAGLVEIKECPSKSREYWYCILYDIKEHLRGRYDRDKMQPWRSDGKQNPSQHVREVAFIHRTVGDFLRTQHGTLFRNANDSSDTTKAILRGKLGVLNLIPIIVSPFGRSKHYVSFFSVIEEVMGFANLVGQSEAFPITDESCAEVAVTMVDQIFRTVGFVDAKLNGPCVPWFKHYTGRHMIFDELPFHDAPGFGAFFGCQRYFMHSSMLQSFSHEHLTYLLACAVSGLSSDHEAYQEIKASLYIIRELLDHGADPNSPLLLDPTNWAKHVRRTSPWVVFFMRVVKLVLEVEDDIHVGEPDEELLILHPLSSRYLKEIIVPFLPSADPNSSIFSDVDFMAGGARAIVHLEETPLSSQDTMLRFALDLGAVSSPYFELAKMLRSYGGIEGRRCHFIRFEEIQPEAKGYEHISEDSRYCLSQDQSDSLCKILQSRFDRYSGDFKVERKLHQEECLEDFMNLVATLTDADIFNAKKRDDRDAWGEPECMSCRQRPRESTPSEDSP